METISTVRKDRGKASSPGSSLIVLNSSQTRYHVVRAAALKRGWLLEEGGCHNDIPESFYGVSLHAARVTESPARRLGALVYAADSTPQVLWVDKSVTHRRVAALKPHQRLNHFVGMSCIARKATLFRRLMCILDRCATTEPSAGKEQFTSLLDTMRRFYPPSFATGMSLSAFAAHVRRGETLCNEDSARVFYIIKPNKGCQGKGILITQHPTEALTGQGRTGMDTGFLVQEYIDRPLCIDGRKFDIRLYVLITSISAPARSRLRLGRGRSNAHDASTPMRGAAAETLPPELEGVHVFVHRRGLVRICADAYQPPTDDNVGCRSMHLTNYAVNKHSKRYTVDECPLAGPAEQSNEAMGQADTAPRDPVEGEALVCGGTKRDLDFLEVFLNSLPGRPSGINEDTGVLRGNDRPCEGSLWAQVKRRIDECIVLTVLSGLPALRRELAGAAAMSSTRGDYRHNCFELLGFDILLREDNLEPVLMEVNHSPSLFCDTSFDFSVKLDVVSDTFSLLETRIASLEELQFRNSSSFALNKRCHNQSAPKPGYPTSYGFDVHSEVLSEEQLVDSGSVGFVQLLPQRVPCGGWTEEERQRQRAMLLLANGLP
ncbi:unnamed protein product [Phytomonas sp. EM1]|nr:unnamed protein product [Phytomonas sp. EM1]|eukprot:CCW59549.1 unnamed protein product [Phytomonas sp. isolate EM1]